MDSEKVTATKMEHLTGTKAVQIHFMPNSEDKYRMLIRLYSSFALFISN